MRPARQDPKEEYDEYVSVCGVGIKSRSAVWPWKNTLFEERGTNSYMNRGNVLKPSEVHDSMKIWAAQLKRDVIFWTGLLVNLYEGGTKKVCTPCEYVIHIHPKALKMWSTSVHKSVISSVRHTSEPDPIKNRKVSKFLGRFWDKTCSDFGSHNPTKMCYNRKYKSASKKEHSKPTKHKNTPKWVPKTKERSCFFRHVGFAVFLKDVLNDILTFEVRNDPQKYLQTEPNCKTNCTANKNMRQVPTTQTKPKTNPKLKKQKKASQMEANNCLLLQTGKQIRIWQKGTTWRNGSRAREGGRGKGKPFPEGKKGSKGVCTYLAKPAVAQRAGGINWFWLDLIGLGLDLVCLSLI